MADDGEYERIPCQDLVLVAQVEGQHLLHSLPITVQLAQPSVVSSSVQARDLVVRVDVRRGTRLWNLAPQDVAVRVVHKSANEKTFSTKLSMFSPPHLTLDKAVSLWMSRANVSESPNSPLLPLFPRPRVFSQVEF